MTTSTELMAASELSGYWLADQETLNCPGPWPDDLEKLFPQAMQHRAQQEIPTWPGYSMSALHRLHTIATTANVAEVLYKDESTRFGLGSFKALGGAYAVVYFLTQHLRDTTGSAVTTSDVRDGKYATEAASVTVASATDGNHGRSVAWGARMAGCRCRIYIHREVSKAREQAMTELGADVIRIDGDYDDSVRECANESAANGWQVISDTSYPGYMDIPMQVMAGYTTMVSEIIQQETQAPTHVLIQAGVGGLAAAISASLWSHWGENAPRIIIVESEHADCIIRSLRNNKPTTVSIKHETMMAGLSCGEISLVAFEILKQCASAVITIPDTSVAPAMRMMANSRVSDNDESNNIESGECAVPGIIGLLALSKDDELKSRLQIDENSRVLVFGCEGATDPELYDQIINAPAS